MWKQTRVTGVFLSLFIVFMFLFSLPPSVPEEWWVLPPLYRQTAHTDNLQAAKNYDERIRF